MIVPKNKSKKIQKEESVKIEEQIRKLMKEAGEEKRQTIPSVVTIVPDLMFTSKNFIKETQKILEIQKRKESKKRRKINAKKAKTNG